MSKPKKPASLTAGRDATVHALIRKSSAGYAVMVEVAGRDELEVVQAKDRTSAIAEAMRIIDREINAPGFRIVAQGKSK